jgi:hypothetical protein
MYFFIKIFVIFTKINKKMRVTKQKKKINEIKQKSRIDGIVG